MAVRNVSDSGGGAGCSLVGIGDGGVGGAHDEDDVLTPLSARLVKDSFSLCCSAHMISRPKYKPCEGSQAS